MNPHDEIKDEEPVAAALAAIESDAAPLDADVLARLRGQTIAVFSAATPTAPVPARFRNARRWLAAAAAVAIIAAGLNIWFAMSRGPTLGQALDKTEQADTMHARLVHGKDQLEFWRTSKPHRSRWDHLDGTYWISDGEKHWFVNESANAAVLVPASKAARRAGHRLVNAELLGITDVNFRGLVPHERIRDGESDVLVYRGDFQVREGRMWLEAHVDARTLRLQFLRTGLGEIGKGKPLAELKVLAYDVPIGAEKFAIGDTLTEDGRIGKVTDVQGIVTIKPVLHDRWTPVREHLVLKPGDWVRTDARGANASALRLVKQTGVILGPKTLVELVGPKQVRLIEGEIEITPSAGATVELVGPDMRKIAVKGKQFFRVEKQQVVLVAKDPPWLLGFKGTTTNETLGSLVALVDGRNVPLTVGYHKVTVDIRDQIARTVIEESFVNHTDRELEGTFHFPLPADASISGFGMWIGDNLVEADVVEKQRAREIYETILRERRDPGLLEWSGGNIFKARVFPIAAHSEKRIKITYTQVLPLKGSRYRYSYALQSEMLQQNPLRDLSIDVKVNSVTPLRSVSSPTHPTRDERTPHSAHVEFTAQQYVPTRDFEVVVELDGRQADVVMIPHRRGDDGYFMLQLTPPGTGGDWDRPILANGEPLRLLILADTSASIDAGQRATQATFIGALLSALTPKDTFNLATCDVATDWMFPQAVAADDKNVASARDLLAARSSLGWSNLDSAFAAALKQVGADRATHVIYVGDGIVTTGDGDPVAFTKRLRRLYQGHGAAFHAVTLGSSYEAGVMKAIASLGGGSMRKISSEQGPTAIARELLGEIAQPALRDVKVEFKGLKAARVYPEALANIPAGSQQILLGRYLPEGKDQSGEVIVTGTQGGKPVRFSTHVNLKDAEQGNSFIPRLWARMHLDSLLEQGSSEIIRDEVIALSEEYQIITPYTSFLVLETDADRERFKVKRRFQMRDGERFFADGRDNAVFDLAQKQMKRANQWRTALRRSVLSELARLGREPRLFQASTPYNRKYAKSLELMLGDSDGDFGLNEPLSALGQVPLWEFEALGDEIQAGWKDKASKDVFDKFRVAGVKSELAADHLLEDRMELGEPSPEFGFDVLMRGLAFGSEKASLAISEGFDFKYRDEAKPLGGLGGRGVEYFGRAVRGPHYGQWLNTLFPILHGAPGEAKLATSKWPAAARELAKSLLRTTSLAKLTDGVVINRQSDTFDVRWGDLTARSRRLELASAKAWLTRAASDGGQTFVSWCDAKEIGVYSKAFQLGRKRESTARDVQPPPLELADYSLVSLEQTYAEYPASIEARGKERALLVLKHPSSPLYETRILIDTTRHVILSIEDWHKDKVTHVTQFDDFVEVAGSWWAQRIEATDENRKRLSLATQTIKAAPLKAFEQQMKAELADRASVQFLNMPMPSVANAKKELAGGKAGFDEHFVLMLHFYRSQQWPRVLDHLTQAEKAANKPGMRWVRSAVLRDSRRNEDVRQRYSAEAKGLVKSTSTEAYALAEHIVNEAARVLQANEMLTLLDVLQPLYQKQPAHVHARKRWQQLRVSYLNQTGRTEEAVSAQKQLATDYPHDYVIQQQYAQALAGAGDYPGAYAWLTRVLVKEAKWLDYEEDSLRSAYTQLMQQQGRYPDLVKYLEEWVGREPTTGAAYEQYLSALIKSDQIEKADALALRWLKDAQVAGALPPGTEVRRNVAVQRMLGNAYNLNINRVEERWLAPLAQAVLYFARHETSYYTAEQILSNYQFQRSEEAPRVRKQLAAILVAEIDKLSPPQAQRFVGWVHGEDLEPAAWQKIGAVLRQRWGKEADADAKNALGEALLTVFARHAVPTEPLAFLRLQRLDGPEKYRAQYTKRLFERLLREDWTAEYENELFSLMDKLSEAADPGARLLSAVAALHRLTDRLLEGRIAAETKLLEHPEKLKRPELLKKHEADRRLAKEGLADRLRTEAAKHPKALAAWLIAESLYLDVTLERNLAKAEAEAWVFVGGAPKKREAMEANVQTTLNEVLKQRYLTMLMNLAARKGAAPAAGERLIKYFEQGIGVTAEANRWKQSKYRFLVALDRTKELEQLLGQWTRVDDPDNRWHIALGYLLAEQGKLPEAIREFEAVEAADELNPAEYRVLADLYLVQNQRPAHERAAAAVYQTMPEYRLSQLIGARLQPWHSRDGRLPTELDKEVLRQFAVLFDKSATPQSYLYQLQQFYQASHDFRLLSGLPDALVGHSAARVYPFVQGMQSVFDEVRDEATADEIVKRIDEVRPRAKTAVDQRALDLLEVLVERRAAEVVNQPGPHREKALAALVRASKGTWGPGEPRLMADFLFSLGKITQQALAEEQLRQLKGMHLAEPGRGTLDRLHIGQRHALTLNSYQRRVEAIDLLQAALNEFQEAHAGILPTSANDALASLIGLHEDARHYAKGEKILLAQLEHPVHGQQRRWLTSRLNTLYHYALIQDGEVSLGKGAKLYQALNAKIQKDLADSDQNQRYELVLLLCRVYHTAHNKKLPGVAADAKTFAFKVAPALLKQQTNYHDSIVGTLASTLYDVSSPRDGIVFLLDQIEGEPRWLRYNNQDGWSRHGWALASWRMHAKDLGDAESRLLKLVLAELRRDLEIREARSRSMYHKQDDSGRFWKEKAADFAKVAEAVLAERSKSNLTAQYIADYFYLGLDRPKRAIEILQMAHKQKILDETGQAKLIDFLHKQEMFAASIPVLQPLVARRPHHIDYRVQLMRAYFKTQRQADLRALLKDTDAYFHEKDRWGEHPMSELAQSTLQNELFDQSVAYFKELIPLHERTQPNRGIGNGVLARYYTGQANAFAGLNKTKEAVESAGAAIVAWGKHHKERIRALETLKQVLLRSPDLDAYVTQFDKEKQDSAIIRKALGEAYQAREQHAKAVVQLRKAVELQPNDAEIHQLLVASLDAVGAKEAGMRQLLQAVQLSRRELKLYQDLGKRYAAAKQPLEAERAYTSIVEMQPLETESHALLAEIREKQGRLEDAMHEWEQVARLRTLEPTGYLKLVAVQIRAKQWDKARESLRKLEGRTWPPRFGDMRYQIRLLEEKLAKARQK